MLHGCGPDCLTLAERTRRQPGDDLRHRHRGLGQRHRRAVGRAVIGGIATGEVVAAVLCLGARMPPSERCSSTDWGGDTFRPYASPSRPRLHSCH